MKKFFAMMTALLLLVTCFTGCAGTPKASDPPPATPAPTEAQPEASAPASADPGDWSSLKVAHLTERLGDNGFNDGCYAGVERFTKEHGCELTVVEVAELNDYSINARTFAQEGYDIVVITTAAAVELITDVAAEFPETEFIITGGQNTGIKNLTSFEFAQYENGFLAGAFCVLMNQELGHAAKSGFVSGVRSPAMERSQYGFTAGSEYVDGECIVVYVGDWTDVAKGKEIAMQMYQNDIRIVQAFAGGAGVGVYQAAESMGDGYYSMGSADGQFHLSDTILASMMQNNSDAFHELCRKAAAGELDGTAGVTILDLKSGVVRFGYNPLLEDMVPQSIKDTIAELEAKIISGEIVPPQSEAEYNDFVANVLS
jgi:Uncharacterized ABC-type transport system, periplasmic component/surface lipoprotein